jgi:hypothetical protein
VTYNEFGLCVGWELVSVCPELPLIEKLMMNLNTKVDSYLSDGTEAGICSLLILQDQPQLA